MCLEESLKFQLNKLIVPDAHLYKFINLDGWASGKAIKLITHELRLKQI